MENRKHAVMETILHRRSIRRFAPEQVREEELQQILQAGLYAPSAGGRQGPIFREQPSIADDPGITDAFYGAPTVITLFGPKNFLFAAEDCAVAAENMMLAADALGVGSCYIGQGWPAFDDPFGQETLGRWGIPADYYAVMQLLLGYPKADDAHPTPKPRKEGRILRV